VVQRIGQPPATIAEIHRGDIGGTLDGTQGRPDLLRVALVAYAAHLSQRARVRTPRELTPWGLAGRIAQVQRWPQGR